MGEGQRPFAPGPICHLVCCLTQVPGLSIMNLEVGRGQTWLGGLCENLGRQCHSLPSCAASLGPSQPLALLCPFSRLVDSTQGISCLYHTLGDFLVLQLTVLDASSCNTPVQSCRATGLPGDHGFLCSALVASLTLFSPFQFQSISLRKIQLNFPYFRSDR